MPETSPTQTSKVGSRLSRLEMGELGLIVAAIAVTWILSGDLAWSPKLKWLIGYCAAVILGQGLLRDIVRMAIRRRSDAAQRKMACLCAESTIGLALLLVGTGGLGLLGVEETRTLTRGSLTALLGVLLVVGFVAKDYVFSVRKEKDHASIMVW